jgi:hypothetical protein
MSGYPTYQEVAATEIECGHIVERRWLDSPTATLMLVVLAGLVVSGPFLLKLSSPVTSHS